MHVNRIYPLDMLFHLCLVENLGEKTLILLMCKKLTFAPFEL